MRRKQRLEDWEENNANVTMCLVLYFAKRFIIGRHLCAGDMKDYRLHPFCLSFVLFSLSPMPFFCPMIVHADLTVNANKAFSHTELMFPVHFMNMHPFKCHILCCCSEPISCLACIKMSLSSNCSSTFKVHLWIAGLSRKYNLNIKKWLGLWNNCSILFLKKTWKIHKLWLRWML